MRQHRIPVHTIGFGLEHLSHDIELTDLQVPPKTLADSRVLAQVTLRQRGYAGQRVQHHLARQRQRRWRFRMYC